VQPARYAVRVRGEHDLVELTRPESFLDGVHGVVPDRHGAAHRTAGRLLDQRQGAGQNLLGLGDLVVAFRMSVGVPLGRSGIGDEESKSRGGTRGTTADRVEQRRRSLSWAAMLAGAL